ncbi:hypothetical protein CAPN001_17550 [Capnocytophaga stomatis]|uniref:hypothetical protein n=1 Tax=Capnocytophaga stomatis TaxID=1848904 RepID=UPI001A55D153|nr:hypothetical protein [Capnocytophaga stomatis]GIJ97186.1 hypothetical protein CAPN001_17550 [Capnocytophaga stomatis]GIM49954.1 hypothetical protein CAPN003_14060 [Capnocytophaga stomatis]
MIDLKSVVLSHSRYTEQVMFVSDAVKGKISTNNNPFSVDIKEGDFLYLTNRKFERYSYLYDNLEEGEVYYNTTMCPGYTSLLICQKLGYLENTELNFPRIEKRISSNKLGNKYCIFQNPLDKLFDYDHNDIVGIYEDYDIALTYFNLFSRQTSVLLAKIKSHIDWH